MGGSVSSGRNNEELVDNLVEVELIKSQSVERVFRAVDRGLFYLPDHRENAYRDLAWREGQIHISAPCIYTRVMESLELRPGQSFLNVGGGTGYLSCMAGLILGAHALNDYIEIHQSLCEYAKQRINAFIKESPYFDEFEFCAPRLIHGNVFALEGQDERYDRIYVGAAVTEPEQEDFIKSLLKRDGVLIMPVNDHLVKIKRVDTDTFESNYIMSVSYASLVPGELEDSIKPFRMPLLQPYTLQELCRFRIRQAIRDSIRSLMPDYYKIQRVKSTFNKDLKTKKEATSSEEDDDEEEDSDDLDRSNDTDEDTGSSSARRTTTSRNSSRRSEREEIDQEFSTRPDPNSNFRLMIHNIENETVHNSIRSLLYSELGSTEESNEDKSSDELKRQQQSSKEIDIPGSTNRAGYATTSDESAFSPSSEPLAKNVRTPTATTTIPSNNENNLSLGESGFGDGDYLPSSSCSPFSLAPASKLNSPAAIMTARRSKQCNHMRQRIMQLPLSLQVKQFMLYERRESQATS